MNVLSLFDGISCGQVALDRAKIEYDAYYASEIDVAAMTITQHHYPKTIQVGDVTKLSSLQFPKIDLMWGGSPCQGFSWAGARMNFEDPRSKLFFQWHRLWQEIKPTHWLLENVIMKKEYKNVITEMMGVEPVEINSSVVSRQARRRLYWTNMKIPSTWRAGGEYNGWLYRLGHGYVAADVSFHKYYPTLCAQAPSTKYRVVSEPIRTIDEYRNNKMYSRSLTPEECEELQTLPAGYTSPLSQKTRRYHCIGNGWTVDVVTQILENNFSRGVVSE